jgi:hypothetical protein
MAMVAISCTVIPAQAPLLRVVLCRKIAFPINRVCLQLALAFSGQSRNIISAVIITSTSILWQLYVWNIDLLFVH